MKSLVPVLLVFLLCVFLVFAAAGGARGAVVTVTKVADTNDGVCDGDCSLREAVIAAASGDTVVFSSLFNSPQTITLTLGQINIDKNLTINGTGLSLVTISGNNAGRIFNISGGVDVSMTGMKLRDGRVGTTSDVDAVGGAILIIGGSLNLTNMELANNTAYHAPTNFGNGGAIAGDDCVLTLTNLDIHHNISPSGAVVAFPTVNIMDSVISNNTMGAQGLTLNIQNVVVSENSSLGVSAEYLTVANSTITDNGRGIASGDAVSTMAVENSIISGNTDAGLSNSGLATIRNTLISNNQFIDSGAGIANGGTMYVIDSAIIGNSARFNGGGIATFGHLFITNSTVSGNVANGVSAQGLGGGIHVYGTNGRLTSTNSSICNNQSKGGGGGIRRDNTQPAIIRNSMIAGNTSTLTNEEDVSGIFTSQGNNLVGNTTGSSGWIGSDLLNVNAVLGPLADNGGGTMTHALLNGSPAINAGNNSLAIDPQTLMALTGDQRGYQRFVAGTVDIGAFEVQPVITGTITYGNAISSPTPSFVSNVLITGVGSPNVSATSLADGSYTLGGFGTSSYTVTPSKTGEVNGITSFDAGLIAQHVVGIDLLIGNQLIVADISGNGTISSFDAAQIARYVTGLGNSGSTGNWIFIPVSRTYPSVTSNITGEDFIALMMGDVSGNWANTGARAVDSGKWIVDSEDGGRTENPITITVQHLAAASEKEIVVPVSVQGVADKGIISYEFDLRYDPSVIQPLAEPVDVTGTVSRGLSVVTNANEPGLLRVVVYGAFPIDENGVLLNLRFSGVGASGSFSTLMFERIMFNEGDADISVASGLIEISK